jgi:3-oxoacyl-[acyl-carrier protein] reductase
VLVVGGSSGIGNGIAQAFRARGAQVTVCGTAQAQRTIPDEGSHLEGLDYFHLTSATRRRSKVEPPFQKLDVLVLAQAR